MKKNKLTMQCSCGNDQAWLITVKGGLNHDGTYKPHRYYIVCGACDAEIELGGLGRAG
jgi:hypothetical protein